MRPDHIKQTFWDDIWSTTRAFHLTIDKACENRLSDFVNNGTDRLIESLPRFDFRKYNEAEANLLIFMGGMVRQARFDHSSTLKVSTFEAVRETFCPLWPFC